MTEAPEAPKLPTFEYEARPMKTEPEEPESKSGLELLPAEMIEGVDCLEVILEEMPSIVEIGKNMITLCAEKGGVGLAAPQIGVFKTFFVYRRDKNTFQLIINPKYYKDGKKTNVVEMCLSYPGQRYFLPRWKKIRASFLSYDGKEFIRQTKMMSAEKAFIYEHECDHLIGKTIKTHGVLMDEQD